MKDETKNILTQAASSVGGAIMGQLFANRNDKRQLRMQKKLMGAEYRLNQKGAEEDQRRAMEMWHATNYGAQVEELQKAGLNTGLMYEGGGAGGSTSGAGTGSGVTGGHAPSGGGELGMGAQLGLQSAMAQAQIKLAESQANKNNVEADKLSGTDTAESQSRIAKLAAETTNEQLKTVLLNYEQRQQKVETNVMEKSETWLLQEIEGNARQAMAGADKTETSASVSRETKQSQLDAIRADAVAKGITVSLLKEQVLTQKEITAETREKINKIAQEIINLKSQLNEKGENRQIKLDEIKTEFNTNWEANAIRWLNAGGNVADALLKGKTKTTKTRTDKGEDWSETTTTYK